MTENEAFEWLRAISATQSNSLNKNSLTDRKEALHMAVVALKEIQQYREIGTVRECQEAMERQKPKKPVKDKYNHDCCPGCGWIVYQDEWGGRYLPHCENCGQTILWENKNDTSI